MSRYGPRKRESDGLVKSNDFRLFVRAVRLSLLLMICVFYTVPQGRKIVVHVYDRHNIRQVAWIVPLSPSFDYHMNIKEGR